MQHVFVIGAKSLGTYGGYETFIKNLIEQHENNYQIKYHIACKANGEGHMDEETLEEVEKINDNEFLYKQAHCFKIKVPSIGAAVAIYYDVCALSYCCKYILENNIRNPIIYILACRIGPFMSYFKRKIRNLGGRIFVNPDGHEWKRQKWNALVRKYWKLSEKLMVKEADLIVCDSKNIKKYIECCYKRFQPKTKYIAYGANLSNKTTSNDEKINKWCSEHGLEKKEYYLIVGRFVPENNYETMIREFMSSNTKKQLAIITNYNDKFLAQLEKELHYKKDKRIKFVGTVYDRELLVKIRENAYAYLHGHEVGGTNPSLLEALCSTNLNLLLNVGFNREVGEDAALYWEKQEGSLSDLIAFAEQMDENAYNEYGVKAKMRIKEEYSWEYIAEKYEEIFL
ncbi:MAG: DUF1972 domain-containing protein [Acutalibacteraceae bacterium]|nr:DUF1972 domain-containing protein [Acutalibacteraceae bacterium]